MAKKLKNLRLTSVDLVRRGANQQADICIYKSEDAEDSAEAPTVPTESEKNIFKRFLTWMRENPSECADEDVSADENVEKDYASFNTITTEHENRDKIWKYTDALTCSIRSIQDDRDLANDQKLQMMRQSLSEFDIAMGSLFEALCKYSPAQAEPSPVVAKSDPEIIDIEDISAKK